MAFISRIVTSSIINSICKYSYRNITVDIRAVSNTSPQSSYSCNFIKQKLLVYGLTENKSEAIAARSEFMYVDECEVNLMLKALEKCQFGSKYLMELIQEHPLLLLVDAKIFEFTYSKLLNLFTKPYVYSILLNSPEVLNDNWDMISAKLKYLQENMLISNSDIVNSGALRHPLSFIKLRHEFLKRTGVYKTLKPKMKSVERRKINPTVDKVLNSTEEQFVKLAGVSLLEFEVFEELYNSEEE